MNDFLVDVASTQLIPNIKAKYSFASGIEVFSVRDCVEVGIFNFVT